MSAQNRELVELVSRVCRLEAQNRKLRSLTAAIMTAAVVFLIAGIYLASGRGLMAATQAPASQPAVVSVLIARELRIVDDYGQTRARLGVSASGEGRLLLLDHRGRALFDAPSDRNELHIIPVQR